VYTIPLSFCERNNSHKYSTRAFWWLKEGAHQFKLCCQALKLLIGSECREYERHSQRLFLSHRNVATSWRISSIYTSDAWLPGKSLRCSYIRLRVFQPPSQRNLNRTNYIEADRPKVTRQCLAYKLRVREACNICF
jgi:hypothetical protein